jgi:hypothetical protein
MPVTIALGQQAGDRKSRSKGIESTQQQFPGARVMKLPATRFTVFGAAALLVAIAALFAINRSTSKREPLPLDARFSTDDLARPLMAAGEVLQPIREAQDGLGAAFVGSGDIKPADLADRLEMTFGALQNVSERIPRQTFDPEAILHAVGHEPVKILNWVRTETTLVAYQGLLRGPIGVLLDRVGNSLDRSILLHELLQRTDQKVRLARVSLTNQQSAELLQLVKAGTLHVLPEAPDSMQKTVDDFLDAYAKRFGADAAVLRNRVKAVRDAAHAMELEASRRAEVQSATLVELVGPRLRQSQASGETQQLQALRDHWWVQLQQGDRWIDLDPAGIVADGNVSPEATLQPEQIEDAMRHSFKIRVSIECACSEGLRERPVLDQVVRLSEITGVPISLWQLPAGEQPSFNAAGGPESGSQIRQWLENQKEWTVVLAIGSKVTAPMNITSAGEVQKPGTTNTESGDLLGGLGGEGSSPAASGTLTAETIDFEMYTPGQPVRTERRYLFDWIGPEIRARKNSSPPANAIAGHPMDMVIQTEILPLASQPSSDFVAHLAAVSALSHNSSLTTALREPSKVSSSDQPSMSAEFPGQLYALALARRNWSRYSNRIYIARANLLTRHQSFAVAPDGTLRQATSFDIVRNDMEVLDAPGVDPGAVLIYQGVLDSNAEVLIASFDGAAVNLAEIQAGKGRGIRWEIKEDSADPRHRRDVTNGQLIVTPVGAAAEGWWRIDAKTGTALAITPAGWGGTQAMATFARLNEQQIRTAGIIFRFMMAAHCQVSAMRKTMGENYRSAATVAAAALLRAGACQAGAYLGVLGISAGGTYGNLLSRSGDIFSIAFSLSSYF